MTNTLDRRKNEGCVKARQNKKIQPLLSLVDKKNLTCCLLKIKYVVDKKIFGHRRQFENSNKRLAILLLTGL